MIHNEHEQKLNNSYLGRGKKEGRERRAGAGRTPGLEAVDKEVT